MSDPAEARTVADFDFYVRDAGPNAFNASSSPDRSEAGDVTARYASEAAAGFIRSYLYVLDGLSTAHVEVQLAITHRVMRVISD